jgi:hypothetical protein
MSLTFLTLLWGSKTSLTSLSMKIASWNIRLSWSIQIIGRKVRIWLRKLAFIVHSFYRGFRVHRLIIWMSSPQILNWSGLLSFIMWLFKLLDWGFRIFFIIINLRPDIFNRCCVVLWKMLTVVENLLRRIFYIVFILIAWTINTSKSLNSSLLFMELMELDLLFLFQFLFSNYNGCLCMNWIITLILLFLTWIKSSNFTTYLPSW